MLATALIVQLTGLCIIVVAVKKIDQIVVLIITVL